MGLGLRPGKPLLAPEMGAVLGDLGSKSLFQLVPFCFLNIPHGCWMGTSNIPCPKSPIHTLLNLHLLQGLTAQNTGCLPLTQGLRTHRLLSLFHRSLLPSTTRSTFILLCNTPHMPGTLCESLPSDSLAILPQAHS